VSFQGTAGKTHIIICNQQAAVSEALLYIPEGLTTKTQTHSHLSNPVPFVCVCVRMTQNKLYAALQNRQVESILGEEIVPRGWRSE